MRAEYRIKVGFLLQAVEQWYVITISPLPSVANFVPNGSTIRRPSQSQIPFTLIRTTMTSNAGRSTFPGHFTSSRSPSPPSSPPYQPRDSGTRKDNGQGLQIPLTSGSDFNLPGAYPTSPRVPPLSASGHGDTLGAQADTPMRGAMQRLPNRDADATRKRGAEEQGSAPDHRGTTPEGDFGSRDTSVEEAEKSVGSMSLDETRDRSTTEENRTYAHTLFCLCFPPTHTAR